MKGVLAKLFTLFDQTGTVMDQSSLVTFLSEIHLIPSTALQDYIKWSVLCNEYTDINGIKRPTVFQAVWHYDSGDLVYFDGKGTITAYN